MKAYVVEKEALSHNIELLQKMANGVPIWAVLKGNGYGIGVLPLARHLAEAGIDHFCVTEVREAELLRENGFEDAAILMLRSTGDPAELNRLMDLRVILTIGSWETACAINAIAAERADVVEAHLKIDTGMGRYGFLPEDMDHILGVYREQKNIAVSGVYTHFNCAFGSKKLTHQEFETFQKTVSAIRCAPSAMPRRMWRSCASCRRATRQATAPCGLRARIRRSPLSPSAGTTASASAATAASHASATA